MWSTICFLTLFRASGDEHLDESPGEQNTNNLKLGSLTYYTIYGTKANLTLDDTMKAKIIINKFNSSLGYHDKHSFSKSMIACMMDLPSMFEGAWGHPERSLQCPQFSHSIKYDGTEGIGRQQNFHKHIVALEKQTFSAFISDKKIVYMYETGIWWRNDM